MPTHPTFGDSPIVAADVCRGFFDGDKGADVLIASHATASLMRLVRFSDCSLHSFSHGCRCRDCTEELV
jgi:hypothetical protein